MYVKVSFQPHTQCISGENSCASLPKKQQAGLTNISHVETFLPTLNLIKRIIFSNCSFRPRCKLIDLMGQFKIP